MKMTMHIDDDLLKRVMDFYDLETKTDAIHFALKELERRAAMKEFTGKGLGLSADDYVDAIDTASNHESSLRVAEDPVTYGKPGPR
jgi:Arc/MetJ family transcription regulator